MPGPIFICTRGSRRTPTHCSVCKTREGTRQCDGPKPRRKSGTCDTCTHHVPEGDRDYCPGCKQSPLPGVDTRPADKPVRTPSTNLSLFPSE
jgi:hypothetical protein